MPTARKPQPSPFQPSGGVPTKEDFPPLSPAVEGSSEALSRRTDRLEASVADLGSDVAALATGQQALTQQINELVQGIRGLTAQQQPVQSLASEEQPSRQSSRVAAPPPRLLQPAAAQQESFVDYRLFADLIEPGFEANQPPPAAPLRPHLFSIENDPAYYRQLSSSKFEEALEEY